MLKWTVAALTDQGVKRSDNQDNFYVSEDKYVFAVADGMGGTLGGATAALLTVEAIKDSCQKKPQNAAEIKSWLVSTVESANDRVYNHGAENPTVRGMGTTVVLARQTDTGELHIAHVGDSRAYLIRDGKTTALTEDHSLVMELFRSGHITEEQMKESPFKHYITRCIGHKSKVEVDETPSQLKANDNLLLCTDGLMAVLSDKEIGTIIENAEHPEAACKELVKQTLDGGAPDNVTVIVVKYFDDNTDGKN